MQIAVTLEEGKARVIDLSEAEIAKEQNPKMARLGFNAFMDAHGWNKYGPSRGGGPTVSPFLSSETTTSYEIATSGKARQCSTIAAERLMKELAKVHKSQSYKDGLYSVELVDENLCEWRVTLSADALDKDCLLYIDLVELRGKGKDGHVELRFSYNDNYPFEPPFVRIVRPYLHGRFLPTGGAICTEMLSPNVMFPSLSL